MYIFNPANVSIIIDKDELEGLDKEELIRIETENDFYEYKYGAGGQNYIRKKRQNEIYKITLFLLPFSKGNNLLYKYYKKDLDQNKGKFSMVVSYEKETFLFEDCSITKYPTITYKGETWVNEWVITSPNVELNNDS
jgi:hypothetical protein